MPTVSELWVIIRALVHENKRLRRKLRTLDARPPFARPMVLRDATAQNKLIPDGSQPDTMVSNTMVLLTPAQLAVAECIVEAMTTRQIAAHLQCEASTIKTHRRAIRKALGVSDCEGLKACRGRWMRD